MDNPSQSQHHMYSILDAARIFGEIDTAQQLQTNFLSLYMGQSEELLSSVAPYLFSFQPNTEYGKWLFEKGWGNSWGMFIETNITLEELRKHFRKFLLVKTEDGKELYFRFYDPRVLRIFLPTCDEQQLKDFFGPINKFSMESEDAEIALEFTFEDGTLIKKEIAKEVFWKNLNGGENATAYFADKKLIKDELTNPDEQKGDTKDEPSKDKPNRKWNFLID